MAIDVSTLAKLTEAMAPTATNGASGAVPGETPAAAKAGRARESYQRTARWMLAAFAAVGIVIFGSLPFAAIADVDVSWPGSLLLVGGLVLAVAGIVAAVVAVSLVSEPEDASLGELDRDLRAVSGGTFRFGPDGCPVLAVGRFRAWWNPRLASRMELALILHGPEAGAHLGPCLGDRPTVDLLIKKLGELEERHARLAPAVARLTVGVETHTARVAELGALVETLRAQPPAPRLDEAVAEYGTAVAALGAARTALAEEKAALAAVDSELALYHDHRDLVIAESSVLQLRGTFRLARRVLAVAAMLTLLGGTAYALSLPAATNNDPAAATTAR